MDHADDSDDTEDTENTENTEDTDSSEVAEHAERPRRSGARGTITRMWSDVGQVVDAARKVPPREAVAYGGLAIVAVAGIVELPVVAAIAGVAWLTTRGRSSNR